MSQYEILFQPIDVGPVSIKNRFAMAPIVLFGMPLYNHHLQTMTRDGIEYYAKRARGGVGLIITSGFKVPHDVEQPGWPEMREEGITALSEMVDLCHAYDCKVFIQLTPGTGRNLMPSQLAQGMTPVSSSALPSVWDPGIMCRPLTTVEVKTIINAYRPAAELALTAGIDGIEVHSHEGYLLDQFITAFYNRRTDEYGGSFENRMRMPIEILHTIREVVGEAYPVTFRFGVKHFIKDIRTGAVRADGFQEMGRDVDETHEIVRRLEKEGYDGFHIDAGCYDAWFWAHPPMYMKHGPHLELMRGFTDEVDVPIITANRLGMPETAERVVRERLADIVAIGRALLADPEFPKKLEQGDADDIRPCLGCHDGCFGHVVNLGRGLSCSVNPSCGRELYTTLQRSEKPKSVAVIGGGPAGMEFARVAALRGHGVVLYEKKSSLGGHLQEGGVPDFKIDVKRLLAWYRAQMEKLNIELSLGTEINASNREDVDAADVVVVATGSTLIVPDIPGADGDNVATCDEVLLGSVKPGRDVVVIGGGVEGCEVALWLANQGHDVTILEKADDLMTGTRHPVFYTNRNYLQGLLSEANVISLTNADLQRISDRGVEFSLTRAIDRTENQDVFCSGEARTLSCDLVVLAVGTKPEDGPYRLLQGHVKEIYRIGDCRSIGRIHDAVWGGFTLGRSI
jgi:2-enoate reductase